MGFNQRTQLAMHNTQPSQALRSDSTIGTAFTVAKGKPLPGKLAAQGNEYVVLEVGAILLYATNGDGTRYLLSIIPAEHVFTPQSLRLLLSNEGRFRAVAICDLRMRCIKPEEWTRISALHPELNPWVIEQETKQLEIVQFHVAQHLRRSSLDKTRFALWAYAQGVGMTQPCGSKTIKISRSELASWIGVSSDRMCRLIRELHGSGEVEVMGRSIKVSNSMLAKLFI
jgi:CRP-like cAMP-binding protein